MLILENFGSKSIFLERNRHFLPFLGQDSQKSISLLILFLISKPEM